VPKHDFDGADRGFELLVYFGELGKPGSVGTITLYQQVVVVTQYLEYPEHDRNLVELPGYLVVKAFHKFDDALQIVIDTHVGLIENFTFDKSDYQDTRFVVHQFRAYANFKGGLTTRNFIGAGNQVDRIVFTESHHELFGAIDDLEIEISHAPA
jgi:hypothetical protein